MSDVDTARQRLAISSEIFSARLREFVTRFGPEHPKDLFDFQLDLTRLMAEAMQHKSDALTYGIATYAETAFANLALRPLGVIHDAAKEKSR